MGQVFDFGFVPEAALGGLINMDMSSLSADKIAIAVLKTRQVASLNDTYRMDPKPDVLAHLQTLCDKLLGFLLTQFSTAPSTDDVHTLMRGQTFVNVLDVERVRELPEAMVPVAIIRSLISTHKVPVKPDHLSNWLPFMDRYRSQVMSA